MFIYSDHGQNQISFAFAGGIPPPHGIHPQPGTNSKQLDSLTTTAGDVSRLLIAPNKSPMLINLQNGSISIQSGVGEKKGPADVVI